MFNKCIVIERALYALMENQIDYFAEHVPPSLSSLQLGRQKVRGRSFYHVCLDQRMSECRPSIVNRV